jgi:ABC-type branched-subunit amino acid transport system ATPase component
MNVVRGLRDRGVSVLLVEHNVNFVLSLCDQVSVLYNGRLIASGVPAEIRADEQVIDAYLGRS